MPTFEYETNKGTFEIDSNRPLTPQELRDVISRDIPREFQPAGKEQRTTTDVLSSSERAEPTGDPVIDVLTNIQKEFVGPLAQGANAAAFGIPRFLTQNIAGKEFAQQAFPQQSTLPGKLLRFGSEATGLVGGGAATLARKTAERLTPRTIAKIGLSLKAGEAAAAGKAVLSNKILRNAIEGAAFGLLQLTPDEEGVVSLPGQVGQAAFGGVLGGLTPFIGTQLKSAGGKLLKSKAGLPIVGAGKVMGQNLRDLKQYFTKSKTPIAEKLKMKLSDEAAGKLMTIKQETKNAVNNLNTAIERTRRLQKEMVAGKKIELKEQFNNTISELKANIKTIHDSLKINSEQVAEQVRAKLPEMFRANGEVFGKRLDDIARRLSVSGDDLTIGEIDNVFNVIKGQLDDALILDGKPIAMIEALANKYKLDFAPGKAADTIFSNADEKIPLKEFFNDIKNIRKTLTAGAREGTSRFTQEDVAVSIFNDAFGELLETRVPELVELRKAYKPIIDTMKTANRIFKPYKGEYEVGKVAKFFEKKVALENTDKGERLLLDAIERGQGFAPGLGPISPKLRALGNDLKLAKERIQPIKQAMMDKNTLFFQDLDRKFYDELQSLMADRKFIESNSAIQENLIKTVLERRLRQIGLREDIIRNLTQDKKKMGGFIRASLGWGAAIGGGLFGLHQLSRMLGGK